MKILILFLLTSLGSFAQTCENLVSYSILQGHAKIEWSGLSVETIQITLPDYQKIAIPTLGENQLNMQVQPDGSYFIEFINDQKTINTITIEI
jgi:hypothetical protein